MAAQGRAGLRPRGEQGRRHRRVGGPRQRGQRRALGLRRPGRGEQRGEAPDVGGALGRVAGQERDGGQGGALVGVVLLDGGAGERDHRSERLAGVVRQFVPALPLPPQRVQRPGRGGELPRAIPVAVGLHHDLQQLRQRLAAVRAGRGGEQVADQLLRRPAPGLAVGDERREGGKVIGVEAAHHGGRRERVPGGAPGERDERFGGAGVAPFAEGVRGLQPDLRVGVVGQLQHLRGDARIGEVRLGQPQRVLADAGVGVAERGCDDFLLQPAQTVESAERVQSGHGAGG